MSARVQRAVHRIGGGSDETETHVSQSRRTRGSTRSRPRVRNRGQSRSNLETQTRINRDQLETDPPSPPVDSMVYKDELIPQREQDRLDALKRKMKAIEVMKKSKRGRGGKKRFVRQEKPEAKLSESSSDDEVVT
uniref:Uncharacterized protein n=2 Tax=Clastoptera arizonana TaxID=38151 RepID=A0A1B6DJL5_9HEMI